MGQQVNVTCPDDLVAALDRVAAARRMARPELVRAIMLEAVDAHEAGRLAFRRQEGPTLDVSISGLVVQLREALMECSRMQGENLRTAKRLQEAFTGSEATVRVALDRVWAHIRKLNAENFHPFEDRLATLTEYLEAAEERTQAAVSQDLQEVRERLDKVLKAAGEAKVQHNLILGDDRTFSLRFLLRMSWLVGAACIVFFLILAQWWQPMALYVATTLINSDERVCLLVNWKEGVDDCQMPRVFREKALALIAARKEGQDKPEADKPRPETPNKPKGSRR